MENVNVIVKLCGINLMKIVFPVPNQHIKMEINASHVILDVLFAFLKVYALFVKKNISYKEDIVFLEDNFL